MEVDLLSPFNIQSLRILWAEPGLDYDGGALPEQSQYMMEVCADTEGKNWKIALDRSTNQKDMLIEYQTFPEAVARKVRLTVTNGPQQIGVGIVSFTVFGHPLE